LIVLANGIGWPCAYLICDKWLENYSYRIEQDFVPYLFVLTFISICTFALIGLQSIKVATENPVKNLRSE
jgi:putative ABC transport system permease protein